MNKIIIKNLKIFAYHGVHKFEKENGQIFLVDATCETEKLKGYTNDKIEDTVSYSLIIKSIKNSLLNTKNNLLEYTAEKIVEDLFKNFPKILEIELTLKKPEAPICEEFEYVAIKIKRNRNDYFNG